MRSIRNQLVLSITSTIVLLFVLIAVGLYAYMREALEQGMDASLVAKAQAIASAVRYEDGQSPHLNIPEPNASASAFSDDNFYFELRSENGSRIAGRLPHSLMETGFPETAGLERRFSDLRLTDGSVVRLTRWSFSVAREDDDGERKSAKNHRESLIAVVAQDYQIIDRPLAVLLTGLLCAVVIVTAGVVCIVTWGVRKGLRPLGNVGQLADQIEPASLGIRFPQDPTMPTELRPIVEKLNDLLARLEQAFARERRFSAAAAHELRTPVAELQALCDVTLRWPDDQGALMECVQETSMIVRRMGNTVRALMTLARCQAGAERPELQAIALGPAVKDAMAECAATLSRRGLTVEGTIPSDCIIHADPQMLAIVLRNLCDNAAEYAEAGSCIRLGQTSDRTRVQFVIENRTPDLVDLDLARLKEPFWRKDSVRTSGNHAGIGLAIVDAYCKVAEIDWHISLDASWFKVIFAFPRMIDSGGGKVS